MSGSTPPPADWQALVSALKGLDGNLQSLSRIALEATLRIGNLSSTAEPEDAEREFKRSVLPMLLALFECVTSLNEAIAAALVIAERQE